MGKFKGLTMAEKIGYVRDYYTWHIIAGIIAIAIFGWSLNHYVLNPPPQTFLNVSFLGQFVPEDLRNNFEVNLSENILDDHVNYRIVVDNFFFAGNDPSFDMAMTQRMIAMVAAAQLDIFIIAPDEIQGIHNQGFSTNLREVLNPVVFANLYEIEAIAFNEALAPFGLKLESLLYFNNFASGFGIDFSDWVLVVLPNSTRDLAVHAFIDHVLSFPGQFD